MARFFQIHHVALLKSPQHISTRQRTDGYSHY